MLAGMSSSLNRFTPSTCWRKSWSNSFISAVGRGKVNDMDRVRVSGPVGVTTNQKAESVLTPSSSEGGTHT